MTKEKQIDAISGFGVLAALIFGELCVLGLVLSAGRQAPIALALLPLALVVGIFVAKGFAVNDPNMARIMLLFGKYAGTLKESGFFWVNPFYSSEEVSLRAENLETARLKVNDKHANPIEIAAVVVWKVVNPAQAILDVQDYSEFVKLQSETALRHLGASFAYDQEDGKEASLRGQSGEITRRLDKELQNRLDQAGIEVVESRISHLAYAPEIAGAMLQRQQAAAVVAARKYIVDGAVGMVEDALKRIEKKRLVKLSPSQKATMVANLLVVLCSERGAQPIVNMSETASK